MHAGNPNPMRGKRASTREADTDIDHSGILDGGWKKKASDRPRPKRTEEHRQCHIHGLTQTDIYLVFEIHPAVEDAVIHMLVGLVQAMAFGLTSNMYR
jgi:hypothetical protein